MLIQFWKVHRWKDDAYGDVPISKAAMRQLCFASSALKLRCSICSRNEHDSAFAIRRALCGLLRARWMPMLHHHAAMIHSGHSGTLGYLMTRNVVYYPSSVVISRFILIAKCTNSYASRFSQLSYPNLYRRRFRFPSSSISSPLPCYKRGSKLTTSSFGQPIRLVAQHSDVSQGPHSPYATIDVRIFPWNFFPSSSLGSFRFILIQGEKRARSDVRIIRSYVEFYCGRKRVCLCAYWHGMRP